MSEKSDCWVVFEQRLDSAGGESDWQRHLATCADCRAQANELGALMAPLRDAETPALDAAQLASLEDHFLSQIRQEDAAPEPARAPSVRSRWVTRLAIAAGILVLVGAAWLATAWLGSKKSAQNKDRITQGMSAPPGMAPTPRASDKVLVLRVQSTTGRVVHRHGGGPASDTPPTRLSPGAELETMGDQAAAVLVAPARDLRLRLGPRTRLRRLAGKNRHLRLERGEVMAEVRSKIAGGSLRIQTSHGTVTVRGTRFLVQASAAKTVVTVFRGQVHYRARTGTEHLVDAGRRLEDDASQVLVRATQAMAPIPQMRPLSSALDPGAKARPAECSLGRVRRLIRAGRAQAARVAIAACRKTGAHSTTVTVLKMLDAQALLTLGKVSAAVRAYHRIAQQHRGSRLGQNALFTAGQLELSRLGQNKRALATFRRYLKAYPTGRYASEARQLARSLEAGK